MELTIDNQQSKINFTYELARRKLGMRIWGDSCGSGVRPNITSDDDH